MNKYIKPLYILLSIILLLAFIFFYRNNVLNNLRLKNEIVDSKWSEIYANGDRRIVLLKAIVSIAKTKSVYFDSLNLVIENYCKDRTLYKNEFTLDLVKREFELNKEYLKLLPKYKKESLPRQEKDLIKELYNDDIIINKTIDDYNNSTLEYNQYISTFPNFIFAKQKGFIKRKYFTIKYGLKNEDPMVKSKELPEWAKDVDTL